MLRKNHNISNIVNCYGCGVCAIICPKNIIDIRRNRDGFYEPHINSIGTCINCGLCVDVCSFTKSQPAKSAKNIEYYAGWSKNSDIRHICSSGGIGFAIAESLFDKGYMACGVRYNARVKRAEHFIVNNAKDYTQSVGSKYIQSYTVDGFKQLNRKDKFLVTGTPCQIDSIRRYIQQYNIEENYVLLDFFCHGVPSSLLWDKYLQMIEPICGELQNVSWRNKSNGWHDSWAMTNNTLEVDWHNSYGIKILGKKGRLYSKMTNGDLFYKFFLSDICLGKACYYNCKYKLEASAADIRIGDLWGAKYKENKDGVNAVIALTDVGKRVLSDMKNCELVQESKDTLMEGQMSSSPKYNLYGRSVKMLLKTNLSLKSIDIIIFCLSLPKSVLLKIFHLISLK